MKIFITQLFIVATIFNLGAQSSTEWKAGVAKTIITPKLSMWLAGYGARTEPSDGTLHDIWAKAVAIEDQSGHQAVIVTLDLVGITKEISDEIRKEIKDEMGLEKSQIILSTSHTHSGPVLENALFDIYPLNDHEIKRIKQYSRSFTKDIVQLIRKAFRQMEPASLYSGNGVTRFQVNRRNNVEATLVTKSDLNGPHDPAVPVIKVENQKGELMAIIFGYACHPTVLSINQWSGDYPGFAQIELERDHPGAVALFFQGAGADQNPMPRRTIPLAKQYGRTLAAAVDRVLEEEMNPLESSLKTSYKEIMLKLNQPPTKEELVHHCEISESYQLRWGKRLLKNMEDGETFIEEYPYPIQAWKIGNQNLFTLGGELVVGYSVQLKNIFGHDSFVMGYANDVMSYIPTSTILHEGGYEGASAQVVYGLPSTWSFDIENSIINNLVELAKTVGITPPANKLITE